MRKKIKAMLAITVMTVLIMGTSVFARTVDYFSNFYVTYSGNEVDTNWIVKAVTNRQAVINLTPDPGTYWVSVRMKNTSNATRGTCYAQQGTSVTFNSSGTANYYYALGLKSAYNVNGGVIYIYQGSWSPDSY